MKQLDFIAKRIHVCRTPETCTVSFLNGLLMDFFHAANLNTLQGGRGLVKTCPGFGLKLLEHIEALIWSFSFFYKQFCASKKLVREN